MRWILIETVTDKAGWLFIASVLSGCAVGPDYRPPLPGIPDAWQAKKEEVTFNE